ncbi:MAG: chitobiase/beta-hexosaminidase C-terminal domain-containing protein [Eubacteriales bacterium]
MKCENCGAIIQDNKVRCDYCGHILQMVPDYNPLEDVIADEVRSAIQEHTSEIPDMRGYTTRNPRVNAKPVNKEKSARDAKELELRKRKEMERRRALKKKKRNILLGVICSVLFLVILLIYMLYSNSYSGQFSKGETAFARNDYDSAIEFFENCIDKKENKIEAYLQLGYVFMAEKEYNSAKGIILDGLEIEPDNIELNLALIDSYVALDEMEAIHTYMLSLKNADVIEALSDYQSPAPELSLDAGVYEDVQELTITSTGDIYYTLDGTEATEDSTLYTEAIQIGEGTTTVRAISINSEGVPSDEVSAEYIVELPMESAPIVTPSTGQYTQATTITVQVTQGYTAYYTTDNTVPDTTSNVYTGPIDMPEGNTIFTVVLVSADGRYSDTTKRNYDLVIANTDEDEDTVE